MAYGFMFPTLRDANKADPNDKFRTAYIARIRQYYGLGLLVSLVAWNSHAYQARKSYSAAIESEKGRRTNPLLALLPNFRKDQMSDILDSSFKLESNSDSISEVSLMQFDTLKGSAIELLYSFPLVALYRNWSADRTVEALVKQLNPFRWVAHTLTFAQVLVAATLNPIHRGLEHVAGKKWRVVSAVAWGVALIPLFAMLGTNVVANTVKYVANIATNIFDYPLLAASNAYYFVKSKVQHFGKTMIEKPEGITDEQIMAKVAELQGGSTKAALRLEEVFVTPVGKVAEQPEADVVLAGESKAEEVAADSEQSFDHHRAEQQNPAKALLANNSATLFRTERFAPNAAVVNQAVEELATAHRANMASSAA